MDITCPITQSAIREHITIIKCQHTFESSALFNLMIHRSRNNLTISCPVCREGFSLADLFQSKIVQGLINDRKAVATQTDDVVPGLVTPQPPTPPSNSTTVFKGVPSFRTVSPAVEPFNPASDFAPTDLVLDNNKDFGFSIPIYKFIYQSTRDCNNVAELLSETGYLVYDIFERPPRRELHTYIIYSASYLADGRPNNLSLLK